MVGRKSPQFPLRYAAWSLFHFEQPRDELHIPGEPMQAGDHEPGPPAFLVNGELLSGAQPIEAFERVIRRDLKALAVAP